jgi:hypothetical protein
VLYTRDECAVVCEFCVFYLCENVSASTKKKEKKKKNNSIHLGPFLPLTAWHRPTDVFRSIRSPPLRTRKKCLAQCFPSHVFYLRKKQLFGFYKKSQKSNRKKLRIAIKQKREWKREKKSSKQRLTPHTPHTRSKLHYIHTLIHQNFILKYHPCHQINQSTKLPILDFYSSLIAVPQH